MADDCVRWHSVFFNCLCALHEINNICGSNVEKKSLMVYDFDLMNVADFSLDDALLWIFRGWIERRKISIIFYEKKTTIKVTQWNGTYSLQWISKACFSKFFLCKYTFEQSPIVQMWISMSCLYARCDLILWSDSHWLPHIMQFFARQWVNNFLDIIFDSGPGKSRFSWKVYMCLIRDCRFDKRFLQMRHSKLPVFRLR